MALVRVLDLPAYGALIELGVFNHLWLGKQDALVVGKLMPCEKCLKHLDPIEVDFGIIVPSDSRHVDLDVLHTDRLKELDKLFVFVLRLKGR